MSSSALENDATPVKKRALCFFWDNPALMPQITKFCNYLSENHELEFFVISNTFLGKLQFLHAGFQTFTVDELIAKTPPDYDFTITDAQLDEALRYDLIVDKLVGIAAQEGNIKAYAQQASKAYAWLFDTLQPDLSIAWNGGTFLQKTLADISHRHQVSCYFMERGLLPDTLAIDQQGVNYGSSLAGDGWHQIETCLPDSGAKIKLSNYRASIVKANRTIVAHGVSCTEQQARKQLNIPAEATIVLFPLQIETDTNILYYSQLFKTMPSAIHQLQAKLKKFENVYLVIKPHPEDKDRLRELEALCGPRSRLCNDLSLPTLLKTADVVTVINSTVGLEALLYGKPVVVLGQAIYGQKGFTYDVKELTQLESTFADAIATAGIDSFARPGLQSFLINLLTRHLFCTNETDDWNSRQVISAQIMSDVRTTRDNSEFRDHGPLQKLLEYNQIVDDLLLNSDNRSLLFLLPEKTADYLRQAWPEQYHFEDYPRNMGTIKLLTKIFTHYDLAISSKSSYFGWKGRIGKILWELIRARQKILY